MKILETVLLLVLIITAVAAPLQKRLIGTVIVYTVFSLVMALLWMLLRAPDLAITEAAVGAGITGVLFILTLHRIKQLKGGRDE